MAGTTPRLYFDFFVRPNLWDFMERPSDIRLGFNAAVSAFQQADVFYEYYGLRNPSVVAAWPDKKDLLIELSQREPMFGTIQSVATVYKHLYAKGGHYVTGSPMSLNGVGSPDETNLERRWGAGPEDGHVIVNRKDGTTCRLLDALNAVIELWDKTLPEDYD